MKKILVIHGPNLNMLGKRETNIYGNLTLNAINELISDKAVSLGCDIECFQSNSESDIIEKIHSAMDKFNAIIINPAAYTHSSIAIRDALLAINTPFVEVHLSNVHAREAFRKESYFSDRADAVICGCAEKGYLYALDFLANQN